MEKNAIVVTVCGAKGGTGKTSTSANMGGILADLGKQEIQMNIHKHAKLTPLGRERRVNLPAACLSRQAGARTYQTSKQRAHDLPLWTHSYNWHRPIAA